MPDVLDATDLAAALSDLEGWEGTPRDGISKTFRRKDFADSIAFVNRIADVAEEADHHPDLTISWNKVTVTYISHSAGGVTDRDLEGARAVDELAG